MPPARISNGVPVIVSVRIVRIEKDLVVVEFEAPEEGLTIPGGHELLMVDWGAGPRAGIFLIQGGKAIAAMDGRFSVAIDDIKKVAIPVLRHRISTNFQAQAEGKTSEDIIQQLLATVGEPEPPKYEKRKK